MRAAVQVGMPRKRPRYTMLVTRNRSDGWCASIPELRDCRAEASTLRQAKRRARDMLAFVLGPAAAHAEVVDRVELPQPLSDVVQRGKRARARADAEAARAADATRAAATKLLGWGLSTRDVGDVLGVSHQRVSQLFVESKARADALTESTD